MATLRLTERLAQTATPEGMRTIFWDTDQPGFGLRVGQRRKVFIVEARVGGKKRRSTIGIYGMPRPGDRLPWSVLLARKRAKELLGQMAAGVVPGEDEHSGGPTLRDGLKLHVENMAKDRCSPRSIKTLETEVGKHLAPWLDLPIAELTGADLAGVHRSIMEAGEKKGKRAGSNPNNPAGAALANRVVTQVSAIWNALDKLHQLPGRNPASAVTRHTLLARESRIDHDGFAAWHAKVQKLTEVPRDVHMIALFTGVRSEGVRHAREEDFDRDERLLHVRKAKGDKPYTVPLGDTAFAIIEQRIARNPDLMEAWGGAEGWIFPTLSSRKPLRVIPCAEPNRAGLPPVHDLRRTWNSVAMEIGMPRETRELLMNHENHGVNLRHYGQPQSWPHATEWQKKMDAALWERIKRRSD
jgi:hypothetical protein